MEHHDKYINLDKAMEEIRNQKDLLFTPDDVYQLLRQLRFQDGFNIVHCEDCMYYSSTNWILDKTKENVCDCKNNVIEYPYPSDYCSLGRFRDDGDASN